MRASVSADAETRFQTVAHLGAGGFGAVSEAIDLLTGQHVALKELGDVSATSIARFKQEFRTLADRHHPNLVGLKELIETHERWIIVMELVPGSDLITHVRGPADNDNQTYDEAKLRHALAGMARGLATLHGYGILHRDLKPSNVRVTPEGRAVLLDFGLATSIDPELQAAHFGGFGTVAYMAPEQVMGATVGPAVDWYAFGVCLFQALTGHRPFESEDVSKLLSDKQQLVAPAPSTLMPSVPADLDALCVSLLARDPARRAGAREVFAALDIEADETTFLPLVGSASAQPPFTGRDAELIQLQRALARTNQGAFKVALVEGESGVGKSELMQEFVRREQANHRAFLPLYGRCYENEQVPYKAFDGCIDELARFLRRLPEERCAALLPAGAVLLGQLFPVLRTVGAIAKAPPGDWSADPTARRLEAFAAIIALLRKVTEEHSLALLIDDLQWADTESFRLLLALVEHADPPAVLIVATIRPPDELESEVLHALEGVRRKHRIDVVQIHGLPTQQAADLARSLLGPSAHPKLCELIAYESGGHPLFLNELVQYVQSHDFATRSSLTIEAALRARIERLDPPARELLEMVALAGRPYGSHIFAAALGVDSVEDSARRLLASRLLRLRKSQELGCYHDRIRHTAVGLIARVRLRGLHERLAQALSSDEHVDAIDRARHWDLAGEQVRAVEAYDLASETAFAALAFLQAANLCARALELLGDARDERTQRFLARRADALACAGRRAEAAAFYERAIQSATGRERYVLRERHAHQLIIAGKLDVGSGLLRSLLDELGVRIPRTRIGTIIQVIAYYLWFVLRGGSVKQRPRKEPDREGVFLASIVHNFAVALSPFDQLMMLLLVLRAFRLIIRSSSLELLADVHAGVGWLRTLGGHAIQDVFEECRALALELNNPSSLAHVDFAEGSARLMRFDTVSAATFLERSHATLQTKCPGHNWLLRNVRYHLGMAWYLLGQHRRVAEENERWIVEARERNDQLSIALYAGMGFGYIRHLMRDAPDDALTELRVAMLEAPKNTFAWLHWGDLFATVNTLLYKSGPTAHEWLAARRKVHARPLLLRSAAGRVALALYRALAALHAYESSGEGQRRALTQQALEHVKQVEKSPSPTMRVYAKLLYAQIHTLRGDRRAALESARAAYALAPTSADYQKRLAQYLIVLLETHDAHDPRCEAIVAHFREQGWTNPYGFLRLLLPAIEQLATRAVAEQGGKTLLGGRFEVLGSLGGGGFGDVFEARDVHNGRLLALKELINTHPRSLERFKQEFRAIRDVHHPNLVRLDSLFEHEGVWYIAMELIAGHALLDYTRPMNVPDIARISRVYHDLATGLMAVHDAGFAHRDVTASNVRVTDEGRVVLLDFGLIGRLGDRCEEGTVGSVEYAAPEQLRGAAPTAAADVYGLGTCLFQSITGRLPFEAELAAHFAEKKQRESPPRCAPAGFEALEQVALEMLALAPSARPTLSAVRERLRALSPEQAPTPPEGASLEPAGAFEGRDAELAWLEDVFEHTCDDGLTVALVEGESGVGKSALVAEFSRRFAARYPHGLVLSSRCYESEMVAYKAFDAAIDQLARTLRELTNPVCETLLPKRAALLADLFPVLNSVPAIRHAPKRGLPADPGVRQRGAIACLLELFKALTQRFELMVLIDDIQWADRESFRLLRLFLEQRTALPFLIVATVRPSLEISPEVFDALSVLRASGCAKSITLAGLTEDAAIEFVRDLSASDEPPPERLRALVAEAKGHPLFLRELVEQQRHGTEAQGHLTLDDALKARILSYDEDARTLLALVALAGRPYDTQLFGRALGGAEPRRAVVAGLLSRGLLRRSGANALAPYHDRVARVTLDLLTPDRRRQLCWALADAIEREPMGDPSERARLWNEAGEPERASRAYEQAGDRALATLQFTRAEQSYAIAIALSGEQRDERWRSLVARRGDALVRAGRGTEAAESYAMAAEHASGELAVRLRILATEQAILGAQAEQGLAAARALLTELGLSIPATTARTLAKVLWHRFHLGLSRRTPETKHGALTTTTRMQLDAAWSLAFPLSWLDPLGGALLSIYHYRIALACGEPVHMARALAAQAFGRVVYSPRDKRADHFLEEARALANAHGDVALEAEVTYREGLCATYRGNLVVACERLQQALDVVTERCPDHPWLLTTIRLSLGSVWCNGAQHALLATSMRTWLADARERGDEFTLSTFSALGYGFVGQLMDDAPDAVAEELARHRAKWPAQPFSFVHFGDLIATSWHLLYRGGDAAITWFEAELPRFERARLLRMGHGRATFLFAHATAYLSAYAQGPRARAPELLRAAQALSRELLGVEGVLAAISSAFVAAQVYLIDGREDDARAALDRAEQLARQSGYFAHVDRISYLRAVLDEGLAAQPTRKQSILQRYAQEGWKHPRRAIAMFCPILDVIEANPDA